MENNLEFLKEFVDEELTIRKNYDGSYGIWTVKTGLFHVESLSELTYEKFVNEVNIQKQIDKSFDNDKNDLLYEDINKKFFEFEDNFLK